MIDLADQYTFSHSQVMWKVKLAEGCFVSRNGVKT